MRLNIFTSNSGQTISAGKPKLVGNWTMRCDGGPYDGRDFTFLTEPEDPLVRPVWGPVGLAVYTQKSRDAANRVVLMEPFDGP
jgi:hypothetical protein